MDETTDSIDFGESSKEEKANQIAKDKEQLKSIREGAEHLAEGLKDMKEWDKLYEESKLADRFKNLKYVDREEDAELKQAYEAV